MTSPIHRAIWENAFPADEFVAGDQAPTAAAKQAMDDSLALVLRHRKEKTLHGADQKIAPSVVKELSAAGFFGLLVPEAYGGSRAAFGAFIPFLSRMAAVDATVAGMAAVHGCIGAVDPLVTFGSEEQKQRFLPTLARGEKLSAFAMTEPAAGSDLTALRTTAERRGENYYVTGEKLFVTNLDVGRTIALVCLLDDKPAVFIVDLPETESKSFKLVNYGLHALQHTSNRGVRFNDFPVPAANLLSSPSSGGLAIAYHGLNRGRVSVCANAAGVMRRLLASMLPWGRYRKTFGEPINNRELVERRIGRLASLITAADAVAAWCASLHDRGERGELEGIVAKVFASEALKEAAVDLCLKTHGGRAFLEGHYWGDHLPDFLAPLIYEGESELLGLAFFKSLTKHYATNLFEPLAKRLEALRMHRFRPLSPGNWFVMGDQARPYMGWWFKTRFGRKSMHGMPPELPGEPKLKRHAQFAIRELQRMALVIDRTFQQHQLKIAERQCVVAELSSRIQLLVVSLVTALAGMQQKDELTRRAAEVFCWDANQRLNNRPPDDNFFFEITELGADIAKGEWQPLAGVPEEEIRMKYDR